MPEPVYECCEHCEATTPHDPLWKVLGLPHTTPCRKPHEQQSGGADDGGADACLVCGESHPDSLRHQHPKAREQP